MPPWLSELRATLARNHRQRAVQVATANAARGPAVRTVILRRVEDDGTLVFFTDSRSEKVEQLWDDDRVEVHGWWTKGRVQFRLRGRAVLSTAADDALRTEIWQGLAEEDLVRFLGPAPGSAADAPPSPGEAPPLDGPAETFALVRVRPERVDVLRLDPAGHSRDLFTLSEGAWSARSVAP
jgi:pyridoxamine 5'-phosphate oxidase